MDGLLVRLEASTKEYISIVSFFIIIRERKERKERERERDIEREKNKISKSTEKLSLSFSFLLQNFQYWMTQYPEEWVPHSSIFASKLGNFPFVEPLFAEALISLVLFFFSLLLLFFFFSLLLFFFVVVFFLFSFKRSFALIR